MRRGSPNAILPAYRDCLDAMEADGGPLIAAAVRRLHRPLVGPARWASRADHLVSLGTDMMAAGSDLVAAGGRVRTAGAEAEAYQEAARIISRIACRLRTTITRRAL